MALMAALTAPTEQPTAAQTQSAAVFALIDDNEWCPGGSVYLDLRSGAFMLYPRLARPACGDRTAQAAVEHGTLGLTELQRLRSTYAEARRAGLRRERCDVIISNRGPQAVVITAAGFSASTPEEEGCWSTEANSLYRALFEVFGKPRQPRK
ncbi:hypothetical protein [Sphingomonas sp.]|uniref:hypothetical protein n=1 Tax=Sphingomonas sp. TaxID=28214 RepID=UPI00185D3A3E|nr:hypothetical protein [Sphingomonas sp.]MBA3511211.1 hypothetical protein [Sphingomonas sp.]